MPTRLKDFATAVVAVVEPETAALTVAQLMRQHHIGALVVVDAQDKTRPVGIVTDRDLVLALMAEGLDPDIDHITDPQAWLKLEILQQAVRSARDTALAELGPALGVALGFNSQDGD